MKKLLICLMTLSLSLLLAGNNIFASDSAIINSHTDDNNVFNDQNEMAQIYDEIAKKEGSMNIPSDYTGLRRAGYQWGYPTTKGKILVTGDAYKNLIPTGHAAIVYSKTTVVEALAQGVVSGKNNWTKSKNTCWGLSVTDVTAAQEKKVADWCHSQIGKPYNFNYFNVNTRSKFYCSQLVWAGFKDKYHVDLNTSKYGAAIHPLELVSTDKTMIIYKK